MILRRFIKMMFLALISTFRVIRKENIELEIAFATYNIKNVYIYIATSIVKVTLIDC